MENPASTARNEKDARIIYTAIMQGMSYTAAIIRTSVFARAPLQKQAGALRVTLRLLEATDTAKKDVSIQQAEQDIRAAMKRLGFFSSDKRAAQIEKEKIKEKERLDSPENAFARYADELFYSPIDGNAARVTRIPKKKK